MSERIEPARKAQFFRNLAKLLDTYEAEFVALDGVINVEIGGDLDETGWLDADRALELARRFQSLV